MVKSKFDKKHPHELEGYPLGLCCCCGPTTCIVRFDCPCERTYDILCRCYCARCYVCVCCGPEYKDCGCCRGACPECCCSLPETPNFYPSCQCLPTCQGPKCCANYGCGCCCPCTCLHVTCLNWPVCCRCCCASRCREEHLDFRTGKYIADEVPEEEMTELAPPAAEAMEERAPEVAAAPEAGATGMTALAALVPPLDAPAPSMFCCGPPAAPPAATAI